MQKHWQYAVDTMIDVPLSGFSFFVFIQFNLRYEECSQLLNPISLFGLRFLCECESGAFCYYFFYMRYRCNMTAFKTVHSHSTPMITKRVSMGKSSITLARLFEKLGRGETFEKCIMCIRAGFPSVMWRELHSCTMYIICSILNI